MKYLMVFLAVAFLATVPVLAQDAPPKAAPITSKLIVFNGTDSEGITSGMALDIAGSFNDWKVQAEPLYEVSPKIWLGFLRVYEGSWNGVQVKSKGTWDLKWDLEGLAVAMTGSTIVGTAAEAKAAKLVFFDGNNVSGLTDATKLELQGIPGSPAPLYRIAPKFWVGLAHGDPGTYDVKGAGKGSARSWSLTGGTGTSKLTIDASPASLPQLIVFDGKKAGLADNVQLDVTGDYSNWNKNGFPLTRVANGFWIGLLWAEKDTWTLQVKTKGSFDKMWALDGTPVGEKEGTDFDLKAVSR